MTCFWNTSSWPGIDQTGLTPSNAAFNSLLAQAASNIAAGVPTTIIIDCPVFYSISNNPANTIFYPAGLNFQGMPNGMLITDQLAAPFMFFCNVSNITWRNVHVQYVQPMNGAYMTNQNIPTGYTAVANQFQNAYLGGNTGYLATTSGVTYANSASPVWNGPSALTALINMRGNCRNITFDGCTFDVPANANPGAFIYTLIQFDSEWLPNQIVSSVQGIQTASWASNLVTVTVASGKLSAFTLSHTYWFYISGTIPTGFQSNAVLCTIATSTTFTYPLTTNPGSYSGSGFWGTPTTSTITTAVPTGITFRNCTFDGICMSHVGCAQANFFGNTWNRYSDLQDGTNGIVTFASGSLVAGGTSATLAANWPYFTSTVVGQPYWVKLNTSQVLGMNFTAGSTTANTFVDPITGAASSIVGTMVFSATPGNGATTGYLTSAWTLGFGTYAVVFTNPTNDSRTVMVGTGGSAYNNMTSYVTGNVVNSNYITYTCIANTIGHAPPNAMYWQVTSPWCTFSAALGSLCTSATQTLTLTTAATCGNVGGLAEPATNGYVLLPGPYSPPPHAVYMGSINGAYPAFVNAHSNVDLGVRVYDTPTSRSLSNSGNALSLKVELGRGTSISNWVSYRPDGGFDMEAFDGTEGSTVRDCVAYFNSATPLSDFINNTSSTLPGGSSGTPTFGWRMPGPNPYNNITISDITINDANPSPLQVPFLGTGFTPNSNLKVTGVVCMMGDWGSNATGQPTIQMAGTSVQLEASLYYNSFSSTVAYIGNVQGATVFNQNSDMYIKHYGYRCPAITFSSALTSSVTSLAAGSSSISTAANTVGAYPSGWPFATGVYKALFYDNSVRYVTLTNNQSTMTWTNQAGVGGNWGPLNANSPQTTGTTVQGLYYQNFVSYKPRMDIPLTAGQSTTRFRVDDYANQYFQDSLDTMVVETFSDSQTCIPLAGTTSFTTNLQIFGNSTLVALGINTVSSLGTTNGLTGYTVGYPGSQSALFTNTSVNRNTNPSTFTPAQIATIAAMITGTTRTITIYSVGGTGFDGTGAIQIVFRAQSSFMGS